MTTKDDFTNIPILNDALLSSPDTRAVFADQLHYALIDIGFLYLKYTPVADALNEGIMYLPCIFGLLQERKDPLCMANSPDFEYSPQDRKDERHGELALDIATQFDNNWKQPGKPQYLRLWGSSHVRFLARLLAEGKGKKGEGKGRRIDPNPSSVNDK